MTFNVTYEIVTPESAEHGDFAEHGFISEGGTLRNAIQDLLETRTSRVGGRDDIAWNDDWISVYNSMEYETGANETRALHFPDSVTNAARRRIARFVGVRGA